MLGRRSFLKRSVVGLATAALPVLAVPALVIYADGVTDDSAALQAWIDGDDGVVYADGQRVGDSIDGRRFAIGSTLIVKRGLKFRAIYRSFFELLPGHGPAMVLR